MSAASENEVQTVPEVDPAVVAKAIEEEVTAIIEDHKQVIGKLRSLLSDVHYCGKDVDEYLRREGFCPGCYRHEDNNCMCESSESDREDDEEESSGGAKDEDDQVTIAEDGSTTIIHNDGSHITFSARGHISSLGFPKTVVQSTPGSAINGNGYGSVHIWVRRGTDQVGSASASMKASHYRCSACGETFSHYYDLQGDIFKAMQEEGVSATCAPDKK